MKKLTYILFASVIILTGCSEDLELNDNEQELNVQFLPGKYVAFNAPGVTTTVDPEEADEADESVDLNVQIPTGTTTAVTVNYALSGTAVFGVDYTIDGATSAGGSVVIEHDPDAPDQADLIDNADITVELLKDGVGDGEKTVVVTLTSASSSEAEILIGRAGTDLLRSHSVIISDIDYATVTADPATVDEDNASVMEEDDKAKFIFEANPADDRTAPVDVEYSLSGTAVFGVDYNIVGASATGGTITIPLPATDEDPMEIELAVEILTDSVEDGEKTIIVTLLSADDAGTMLSLGVGGSDDGESATITITDVDATTP